MGVLVSQPIEHVLGRSTPPLQSAGVHKDPACSVNGDARHLLRCTVTRDAQAQKLPRLGRFDRGAVCAKLRGNREVERELRDDGGFRARGIADDVECFSDIPNAEFHGVIHCC